MIPVWVLLLLLGCPYYGPGPHMYRGKSLAQWHRETDHRVLVSFVDRVSRAEMEAMVEGTGAEVLCGGPPGMEPSRCWSVGIRGPFWGPRTYRKLELALREHPLSKQHRPYVQRPAVMECTCDNSDPAERGAGALAGQAAGQTQKRPDPEIEASVNCRLGTPTSMWSG